MVLQQNGMIQVETRTEKSLDVFTPGFKVSSFYHILPCPTLLIGGFLFEYLLETMQGRGKIRTLPPKTQGYPDHMKNHPRTFVTEAHLGWVHEQH